MITGREIRRWRFHAPHHDGALRYGLSWGGLRPPSVITGSLDSLQHPNPLGEVVGIVAEGVYQPGAHMAVWQRSALASGVYFYRLWYEGRTVTRRMLLVK